MISHPRIVKTCMIRRSEVGWVDTCIVRDALWPGLHEIVEIILRWNHVFFQS